MSQQLRGNSLGVTHVTLFVIATAAPLTTLVGVLPAAIAFGNGVGVAGSFVLTGLLYLLFSVGYTSMSRYIGNAGAFYAFICRGLGGTWGVAGAFVAILAYAGVQLSVYTLLGLFVSSAIAEHTGMPPPWWLISIAAATIVHVLSQRSVVFSGRVLSALLVAEIIIVCVLDVAIVAAGGAGHSLTGHDLWPAVVFSNGFGASLAFVVPSFLGFESSTIFAEEARNPARTIRTATYLAVTLITLLYAVSAWAVVQGYDAGTVVDAARRLPEGFYFAATTRYLGTGATDLTKLLLWTSLIAAALSLQNTLVRYLFALGREKVLWGRLATTHARYQSPYIAGRLQTSIVISIVGCSAMLGVDPYSTVFSLTTTVAAIAILAVQALVALAIGRFFAQRKSDVGAWTRTITPALSGVGLLGCIVAILANLPLIAGGRKDVIWAYPAIVALVFLVGATRGSLLRFRNPARYGRLGTSYAADATPGAPLAISGQSQSDTLELERSRAVELIAGPRRDLLLVCEHASNRVPLSWNDLGLAPVLLETHFAWDSGSRELTRALAKRLGAPAILAEFSRLFYDINRPHDHLACMRTDMSGIPIPGNTNLGATERAIRESIAREPFERAVIGKLALRPVLIDIHSFTPVFDGCRRAVEIGVLRLDGAPQGAALLQVLRSQDRFVIGDNEPYDLRTQPQGCLQRLTNSSNLEFMVLEVRSDLLSEESQLAAVAECIVGALRQVLPSGCATRDPPVGHDRPARES